MSDGQQKFRIRWAVAPAIILALLALLSFGKSYFLSSIDRDWESIGPDVNRDLAMQVERSIRSFASELVAEAKDVSRNPHLTAALLDDGPARRTFQRALAERENIHDIAVLGFDTNEDVVVYNRAAPRTSPLDGFDHEGDQWHVVVRSVRSYLLYREPVLDGKRYAGDLVISRALSAALPLSNRFLKSRGFGISLEEQLGVDVEFDFTGESPFARDGRYLHVPFIAGADTLGYAHIQKVIPAFQAARVADSFDAATAFLFVVLFVVVSIPIHRWYSRRFSAGGYFLALTLHVWTLRLAFHGLEIAEALLPTAMLDPVHYASSFGAGMASSLGALLFTLIALTVNVLAAAYRIRNWQLRTPERGWLNALAFTAIIVLQPFILRGFAAAIRSFVADSGFNYDDIASLFDSPMLLLMYACTFLLAVSVAMGIATSITVAARIVPRLTDSYARQAGWVFAASALSLAVYWLTTTEYLLAFPVYILVVGFLAVGVIASAQWSWLRRLRPARAAVIALTLITLTVSALLSVFMNERRRAEVEAIAVSIARPEDTWTKVQVEQALAQIRAMPPEMFSKNRNDYRTAFGLWTATPLSTLQNNSAVVILDGEGNMVSHFLAGVPLKKLDSGYLSKIRDEPEGSSVDVADTTTIESRAFYAGHAAVAGGNGDSLDIYFVVESNDPFAPEGMSFDIIRYEERRRSLAPEDAFLYCEFSHGAMIRTSDPTIPKSMPLPEDAQAALGGGKPSSWSQLALPSGQRAAYFIRSDAVPGNKVYAVALGTPVPLFTGYRILRLGAVYAVCMLLLALVWAGMLRRRIIPASLSFPVRLQLALLFVAAIPTAIVWMTVQQIISDNAAEEHEQSIKRSIATLAANLPQKGQDESNLRATLETLSDRDCFRLRSVTGSDVNLYTGKRLHATSRPELYETALLSSSLPPDAYLGITLENRDFVFATETIGDYSFYVGYAALREANGSLAGILSTPALFAPEITQRASVYATASQYVWFALILVLVVFASGVLARQIARPLRTLIAATQAIAGGDLSRTVETQGSREIEELGAAFNSMTAKLRASQRDLAAAERELAWKEMAKQVAHEIRNPLTPMRLAAQHLRHAYKSGDDNIGALMMKVIDTILEQVEKLNRISTEFSRFARMPRRSLERVDLAVIAEETIRLFRHSEGVVFHLDAESQPYHVTGDREELSSVFTNLIRNAVQAIEGGGEIRVSLQRSSDGLVVEIADSGVGISADVLPRIFEPSFSTKTDGMGLGLAIIKKILDDMSAEIAIQSTPGSGTRVRILFPET